VRNNALRGIAAFEMLPLTPDETVLDRYLALREVAKRGPALRPNRRLSHAAAADIALDHLAQVKGRRTRAASSGTVRPDSRPRHRPRPTSAATGSCCTSTAPSRW
jgi:hypothetical protein